MDLRARAGACCNAGGEDERDSGSSTDCERESCGCDEESSASSLDENGCSIVSRDLLALEFGRIAAGFLVVSVGKLRRGLIAAPLSAARFLEPRVERRA